MADESGKSKRGGSPYIPIAVALFIGIIIGGALFSNRGVERAVEQRLTAAEAALNDQLTAARGEIDQQIEALGQRADSFGEELARLDPVEEGYQALQAAGEEIAQRVEALEADLEEAAAAGEEARATRAEATERMAFLENRVQTMADQMSRVVARLQAGGGATEAAAGAGGGGGGSSAAQTASLRFGQVGELGGTRVFVSRIDEQAGEVGVMTLDGRAGRVASDAPFDLGGGCSLELQGFQDGAAQLAANCGS